MNDFPAVPLDEERPYDSLRELYLYEEPRLLAAIRRGDRREATRSINYLLVHIYSAGEERSDLLKGLLLELVVMISRAAIEAGAPASTVLGMNFKHLTDLSTIQDDEGLARWLRAMLDRLFETIESQEIESAPKAIAKALTYLRSNLSREVTRNETARAAGLSPGHLSHLLKERTGRSYTELLREYRLERACALLHNTTLSLAEVADQCGFCDQAYFSNVFRQMKGMTPRQWRSAQTEEPHALLSAQHSVPQLP